MSICANLFKLLPQSDWHYRIQNKKNGNSSRSTPFKMFTRSQMTSIFPQNCESRTYELTPELFVEVAHIHHFLFSYHYFLRWALLLSGKMHFPKQLPGSRLLVLDLNSSYVMTNFSLSLFPRLSWSWNPTSAVASELDWGAESYFRTQLSISLTFWFDILINYESPSLFTLPRTILYLMVSLFWSPNIALKRVIKWFASGCFLKVIK